MKKKLLALLCIGIVLIQIPSSFADTFISEPTEVIEEEIQTDDSKEDVEKTADIETSEKEEEVEKAEETNEINNDKKNIEQTVQEDDKIVEEKNKEEPVQENESEKENNIEEVKTEGRTLSKEIDGYKIDVSGSIPSDVVLAVSSVSNSSVENTINENSTNSKFISDAAFDIKLEHEDGSIYQPIDFGKTVAINIIGINNTEDLTVYRLEDENITRMFAQTTDDAVKFDTDHFTIYTLGHIKNKFATVNIYVNDELKSSFGITSDDLTQDIQIEDRVNEQGFNPETYVKDEEHYKYIFEYLTVNDESTWTWNNDTWKSKNKNESLRAIENANYNFYYTGEFYDGSWLGLDYYYADNNNDGIKETLYFYGTQTESVIGGNHINVSHEDEFSSWVVNEFDAPYYTNPDVSEIVVKDGTTFIDCEYLFAFMPNVINIEFNETNVEEVKHMNNMFTGSKSLKYVDFSGQYYTDNVETMAYMFADCSSLDTLNEFYFLTDNLKDTSYMFKNCELLKQCEWDFGDLVQLENARGMFYNCRNLEFAKITTCEAPVLKNIEYMFYNCEKMTRADLSKFNLSNVESLAHTFDGCKSITEIPGILNWDVSNVKTFEYAFNNCKELKCIDSYNWITSSAESFAYAFSNCDKLVEISADAWDMKNVKDLTETFANDECLYNIYVGDWILENVITTAGMFKNNHNMDYISTEEWGIKNVTNITDMFYGCDALTELDISDWDLKNVQKADNFLYNTTSLKMLKTPKTTNVEIALSQPLYDLETYEKIDTLEANQTKSRTLKEGITVTFIDSIDNTEFHSVIIPAGGTVELPQTPTHEGMMFDKWDISENDLKEINENKEIKALYKEIVQYTVTIPKTIEISGTDKTAQYEIAVNGTIGKHNNVSITPDDTIDLSTQDKNSEKGYIIQKKKIFNKEDLNTVTTGEINAKSISAGKWYGSLNFNIELH